MSARGAVHLHAATPLQLVCGHQVALARLVESECEDCSFQAQPVEAFRYYRSTDYGRARPRVTERWQVKVAGTWQDFQRGALAE